MQLYSIAVLNLTSAWDNKQRELYSKIKKINKNGIFDYFIQFIQVKMSI